MAGISILVLGYPRLRGPPLDVLLPCLAEIFCVWAGRLPDRETPAPIELSRTNLAKVKGIEYRLPESFRTAARDDQQGTAQLLADLGVTRSLSRPRSADDNPFSEVQFKTLKYHPGWARRHYRRHRLLPVVLPLVQHRHRHAGIAMLTPDDVHRHRAPGAGSARTYPASRLGPSPRTLRPRHPETRPASRSRRNPPATSHQEQLETLFKVAGPLVLFLTADMCLVNFHRSREGKLCSFVEALTDTLH